MRGVASRRITPRRDAGQRGQSLVEFALIAIPALMLMLGVAQFGFLLSTQVGITNTARDIARWAATTPTWSTSGASANAASAYTEMLARLPANVPLYSVSNLNGSAATPPSSVSYCSYTDAMGATAVRVNVTIQYRHPLFFPLLSGILDGLDGATDGALRVGTSEQMHVENDQSVTISGIAAC